MLKPSKNQVLPCDLPHKVSMLGKTPLVLVSCVAAEKEGIDHSTWIEVRTNTQEMRQNIEYILSKSPVANAKQFKFRMSDNFEGLKINPNSSVEQVALLGKSVWTWKKAFVVFTEFYGNSEDEDVAKDFKRTYLGSYTKTEDFIQHKLALEGFELQLKKNHLTWEHFNFEKIVLDWFYASNAPYVRMLSDKVYVFKRETES